MWEYKDTEFVKLNRKILNWEWYSDINTRSVFIHCLLKANWKPGRWKGVPYERGQFVTSLASLSEELGISIKQVRTALKHLEGTGEVANKSYPKFRIITVVKYDEYQTRGKVEGKQWATKGQAEGKQGATDIRNKEYKEVKNINKHTEKIFTPPSVEEVCAYLKSVGSQIDAEEFIQHYESQNWMVGNNKMTSWKSAIVGWEKRRGLKRAKPESSEGARAEEPAIDLWGEDNENI